MSQNTTKKPQEETPMSYEEFLDCLERFASLAEFGEAQKFLQKHPEYMKRCSMELDREREEAENCELFARIDTTGFYQKLMKRNEWYKK